MTISESKGRFFLQNESIQIANWNALLNTICTFSLKPLALIFWIIRNSALVHSVFLCKQGNVVSLKSARVRGRAGKPRVLNSFKNFGFF